MEEEGLKEEIWEEDQWEEKDEEDHWEEKDEEEHWEEEEGGQGGDPWRPQYDGPEGGAGEAEESTETKEEGSSQLLANLQRLKQMRRALLESL